MGETSDYIDSMRCDVCPGCDEPEFCAMSEFTLDALADDATEDDEVCVDPIMEDHAQAYLRSYMR